MNRNKRYPMLLVSLLLPLTLFAQMTVSGTVSDAATGDALAGANVVVEGTDLGAAADAGGNYSIANVPAGATITASMIGYTSSSAAAAATVNFSLDASAIQLSALEVLASRADEKTPVAYTNVTKADMEFRLGSQDIPMSLNMTPSVYATQQGGGAGDARINVRGFNQRNVAVMINGVPQNDMENGWVYWSNWDGVGDATSSIQMQRGLSAVNLATPSIGGTMNILTDPTAHSRGGKFKQELGDGGFLKSTINLNTGLINGNMAFSTTIVRKTGDGIIDKTWTDAWAYYFGASYQMNESNRFELYAIGAPQRHGQNLYKQNAAAYNQDFAKNELGYSQEALDAFAESEHGSGGSLYNENWNEVDPSYTGKQYWYMYGARTVDRHDPNFLNERENFFHKPLVNLNHFLTLSDNMRLSTVLYWSGGSGGGTGTINNDGATFDSTSMSWIPNTGSSGFIWDYSGPSRVADWNATIAMNRDTLDRKGNPKTAGESLAILRNSINRQSTIGAISKLNIDVSEALKVQVGLDWRTAGIEHAREVRDLLGGDYFINYADDNHPDGINAELGDIIAYHNETTVDWLGFFAQGNYSSGPLNLYGMAGFSTISYSYQDHFTVANEKIKSDAIGASQFKTGAMYDLNDNLSMFANFGIVEKPPIMDNVIYFDGTVASDPANEKFQSLEAGVNYSSGNMAVKASYYSTDWKDRNLTKSVTTGQGSSGDTDVIFLTGVNQNHSGIEIQAQAQLMAMLRLDAAISIGTWKFVGDANGNYQEYTSEGTIQTNYDYALDGLFVGDMPQTAYAFGITLTPFSGLRANVSYNMYDKNYSDWSPGAREYDSSDPTDVPDTDQVWEAPGYSKMDVHVTYDIPLGGLNLQAFAHVFNALDAVYVQDAVDNSEYNSYATGWPPEIVNPHTADAAEVFLGSPRYMNFGISVQF